MKVNAGSKSSWADYEEIPILGDDFKSYQMPVSSFILHNANHMTGMPFQVDASVPIVANGKNQLFHINW